MDILSAYVQGEAVDISVVDRRLKSSSIYCGFNGLILTLDISFSPNKIKNEQNEKVRNLPI
jgi:hypothetical protein